MESNRNTSNYGICRCCLVKGHHQDLMKDYFYEGTREVYSEIFIDCFNLFLSSDVRMTTLICTTCVQQLRNALHFKTKVLATEDLLLKSFNSENDKQMVLFNNNVATETVEFKEDIAIKEEVVGVNSDLYHSQLEINDEDDLITEKLDFRERALLNRFPQGSLKVLPNRSKLRKLCSKYFYQLEKLKGKTITAKMLERTFADITEIHPIKSSSDLPRSSKPLKAMSSEKIGHITNITALLTYSNVIAFKTKYKNGFPCFYCNTRFDNLEILRSHQKNHDKENIMALIKKKYRPGRPDCLVVYVEVTDLKCMICERNMPNLNVFKIHLTSEHKKTLYLQYTDRVIPFKIQGSGYMCQICNFYFETFGAIEKHMNTHYRNFVCEQCGAGFIAKNRLKIHVYNIHKGVGVFPCEKCDKTFNTRNKLKIHIDLVHNMVKKIQCPKCPARFSYYFVCQKHLVEVHRMIPIKYKCNVCDKSFTRRFHLSNHIKRDHLDEKNIFCQLCTYNCFSNNELKFHMAKEHCERLFKCSVCEKCYSSQKSLKQHMNVHSVM